MIPVYANLKADSLFYRQNYLLGIKMKLRNFFKLISAAVIFLSAAGCSKKQKVPELVWQTDFEAAKKIAAENNKGIMFLFTGSDWDRYSNKFKKNVVESEQFLIKYADDFVFLNFDFAEREFNAAYLPRNDSQEEADRIEKAQKDFAERDYIARDIYSVTQYPTVLFLSQEGWYLDSVIYTEETSTFTGFEKACHSAQIEKLSSLAEKVRKSSGIEKAGAINELYEATPAIYLAPLRDLIASYPEYDPENKTGNLGKFEQAKAYFDAYEELVHGRDAAAVYVTVAENKDNHLNEAERQNIYFMAALVELQEGKDTGSYDYGAIVDYLQEAYDCDPNNEIGPDILYQLEKARQQYKAQTK